MMFGFPDEMSSQVVELSGLTRRKGCQPSRARVCKAQPTCFGSMTT